MKKKLKQRFGNPSVYSVIMGLFLIGLAVVGTSHNVYIPDLVHEAISSGFWPLFFGNVLLAIIAIIYDISRKEGLDEIGLAILGLFLSLLAIFVTIILFRFPA
jgi:hypothetical protein